MKTVPEKDAIAELVRSLRSDNPLARRAAVRDLGELGHGGEGAVPALRKALLDADDLVRARAARSLGLMGEAALPALLEALQHRDKYVRREATWALRKLGSASEATVQVLAKALRDSDRRVRMGAATALGVLGPEAEAAIPVLIQTLGDTNLVLCRLAAKALVHIGRAALPALSRAVRSKDRFVRREATWAVGQIERTSDQRVGLERADENSTHEAAASIHPLENGNGSKAAAPDDSQSGSTTAGCTPACPTAVLNLETPATQQEVTVTLPDLERLAREVAASVRDRRPTAAK